MKTKIAVLVACVLMVAGVAGAEFSAAEKSEIQKIEDVSGKTRWILYYAANALRNAPPENKALYVDLMKKSWLMHDELRIALNTILTLPSFSGQTQEQLNNDAPYRVATTELYLDRGLGGYRNGPVRNAIQAILDAGGPLSQYAMANLNAAESVYAGIDLSCCAFDDWKLADWPFFVRRASDGVGVHGDFEKAKLELAAGRGYFNQVMNEINNTVDKLPYTPTIYWGVRNVALNFKDTMEVLDGIHLTGFGIPVEPDPFVRLLGANEEALQPAASGFRSMLMFNLRPIVLHLAQNGDGGTGAATNIAEAVERAGDAWFHAIDAWAWESIRFPCLEANAVGCVP